ncbi:hypothetical protein [Peribacillus frigoritolerans]
MITLDQLVPANHLGRKMEASIDFTFIYDLVIDMYSEVGRPSIDPVILVKLTFIQYTFGNPIYVLVQKKDFFANMTMFTMNTWIVTFALREKL